METRQGETDRRAVSNEASLNGARELTPVRVPSSCEPVQDAEYFKDKSLHRTLVESARAGIGFVEVESGRILYCNTAYARLFGLSCRDLSGRSLFEFLDAQQEKKLLREKEARLKGEGAEYELCILAADGSSRHLSATGSPVFAPDGHLRGTVHTIVDISERKRVEDALRESERRFRTTFEAAGVGMAHVSPDGSWLRINDKLCEISGYSREELLGLRFQDLTVPEELNASLERIGRMLAGKLGPYTVDRRYIRKDGSRVWVSLSVSLARKPSGEPDYFVCVAEDITERKVSELVPDPLSVREREVLLCLVEGLTNQQIARRLSYSSGTVKLEVQHILAKLGVKNRRQAVARAVDIGLTPPR
ncbi:helix-turn-helix transcriptional regulator [Rubrobacter radiotolerans]|uniref:helix-turn-helix transcriptional regulator n=1 Tax=Rubrobacter radiotolerans TaxID=42256 RepID=UPI0009D4EC9A|nr:PAS domain S-box protein [Rubrobacter radiotolerans]SMC02746.1 PAS domain S-box-containing protein [Rubrobacter radiotolerans DSM 5868]